MPETINMRTIDRDGEMFVSVDSVIQWMKSLQESTEDGVVKYAVHEMIMMVIRVKNDKT